MKIENVSFTDIRLRALGNRYYEIAEPLSVVINTDKDILVYHFDAGFVTNFRSGGAIVDSFIDQIGDEAHQICWLIHDSNYTPCDMLNMAHPLSKSDSDKLLRAMLRKAGESSFKVDMVYYSVKIFGKSAYYDDDSLTEKNSKLFKFKKN